MYSYNGLRQTNNYTWFKTGMKNFFKKKPSGRGTFKIKFLLYFLILTGKKKSFYANVNRIGTKLFSWAFSSLIYFLSAKWDENLNLKSWKVFWIPPSHFQTYRLICGQSRSLLHSSYCRVGGTRSNTTLTNRTPVIAFIVVAKGRTAGKWNYNNCHYNTAHTAE